MNEKTVEDKVKGTVLVVDDEEVVLESLSDLLRNKGYEVKTASSAEEARKNYEDKTFDIVIIDGLNGECFDLYKDLEAKRKIIFSGDDDLIYSAKEQKIEAYLKFDGLPKDI